MLHVIEIYDVILLFNLFNVVKLSLAMFCNFCRFTTKLTYSIICSDKNEQMCHSNVISFLIFIDVQYSLCMKLKMKWEIIFTTSNGMGLFVKATPTTTLLLLFVFFKGSRLA